MDLKLLSFNIDFPLFNNIIFESNPELSGNTFQVFKEMKKRNINKKYRFIYLVKDCRKYKNENNIYYINYGDNFFEKLYRYVIVFFSKVIIFENRIFLKRWKNQFVFNLTHGIPIKSLNTYVEHDTCDYVITSIECMNKYFAKELDVPISKFVTLGYPRNDMLFIKDNCIKKLKLQNYKKIIFWLPTYRKHKDWKNGEIDGNDYQFGISLMTSKKDLYELNKKLVFLNICLLIKLHPVQDTILQEKDICYSNIIFISDDLLKEKNINLYSLIGEVDALITDYSSIYFDYLLVNKPIALVLNDINEYKKSRGFAIPNYYNYIKGEYIYILLMIYINI